VLPVGAPAHKGRANGLDLWQYVDAMRMQLSAEGLGGFLGIVLDGRGLRNRLAQPCAGTCPAGRPRASPEPAVLLVTGLLSPAVRSLPGARSHDARQDPYVSSLQRATRGSGGPAPGWHGHHHQRSAPGLGHAPYG